MLSLLDQYRDTAAQVHWHRSNREQDNRRTKARKTADYGGLKHYRLGLIGHASDIARKTERLVNLVIRKGNMHIDDLSKNEETVEDTNYVEISYKELDNLHRHLVFSRQTRKFHTKHLELLNFYFFLYLLLHICL